MPERQPNMTYDPPNLAYDPKTLRRQAEQAAATRTSAGELPPAEELPRVVHELQVHQIELEMQNAAMREAQAELEVSRDRYADLFDFAPVGYVTVDEAGAVREINLTACTILGVERGRVLGRRLASHVHAAAKDRFVEYLRACRDAEPGEELTGEFVLAETSEGELSVLVRTGIAANPHTDRREFRLILIDITAHKRVGELRALNETLEQRVAERTAALQLLCDIAVKANRAHSVEEALEFCLRRVAEHTGWQFGHVWLPADDDPDLLVPAYARYPADQRHLGALHEWTLQSPLRRGECLPGLVYATADPHWVADLADGLQPARAERARQLGLTAAVAFPILAESHAAGVLEFFAKQAISPDSEMADLFVGIGTQLGRVLERKAFQDRLLTLSEDEHRRIGQELHDDVGQELTGLALQFETLAEVLLEPEGRVDELVAKIGTIIARIRGKTRNLSRGLVPMEVDAPALATALETLALQVNECRNATCTFSSRGKVRLADGRAATQLYRIAQEAVSNAVKHAQAEHVDIELDSDRAATVLEIRDDGCGLPPKIERSPGRGLDIMRYRAELIRGTLTVESAPSGGTCVRCQVPL
ncbi:MAG: ATP-binding protein [Patescibacteria group bacterium]|nr:ATP-binding protein [Patescibacteria group bacterium]